MCTPTIPNAPFTQAQGLLHKLQKLATNAHPQLRARCRIRCTLLQICARDRPCPPRPQAAVGATDNSAAARRQIKPPSVAQSCPSEPALAAAHSPAAAQPATPQQHTLQHSTAYTFVAPSWEPLVGRSKQHQRVEKEVREAFFVWTPIGACFQAVSHPTKWCTPHASCTLGGCSCQVSVPAAVQTSIWHMQRAGQQVVWHSTITKRL